MVVGKKKAEKGGPVMELITWCLFLCTTGFDRLIPEIDRNIVIKDCEIMLEC